MAPPVLPFDVIEQIIDILYNLDTEDLQYVKNFSLVCHSFLPLCRKHIFSRMISTYMGAPYQNDAFRQLLLESPDIARYIRKLKIYIHIYIKPLNERFIFPVSQLTRLQSLTAHIVIGSNLEWGNFPSSIQRSLLNLMHLSTLTHLDLARIPGFPISNLNGCTNIKHLFLRKVDTIDDEATSLPLCRKSMKLQTLHISLDTPRSIFQDIFRKIQQLEDLSLRIDSM